MWDFNDTKGAKQVSPVKEWRWTLRLSAAVIVIGYQSCHYVLCYVWNVRRAVSKKEWSSRKGKHFSGETCSHSRQIFRLKPAAPLSRPNYGAGFMDHLLPVHRSDYGHCRPHSLLHWNLCTFEFLGLFRAVWASADLPQPGPLDILVHGAPHCVRRRTEPAQTRHTVTAVRVKPDWDRSGRGTELLEPVVQWIRTELASCTSKLMSTCVSLEPLELFSQWRMR